MQVKSILISLLSLWLNYSQVQPTFNRSSFYGVLSGKSLKEIDNELNALDKSPGNSAFKGTLRMKKSGMTADPKDKLKFFKTGRQELESAIAGDSTNSEYRFLRILIQENVPKIVRYNGDIKKDASYLRKHYKTLPSAAKQALLDYSKKSKELKPEYFINAANE
jgi:hypothetical protein